MEVAGWRGHEWAGPQSGQRRVRTGAGLRSQVSQVFVEKLYRTRSPRALLRSWPTNEMSAFKPQAQDDRPPDPPNSPPPHLLTSKDSQQPGWGQEGTSCPDSGREGRVPGTHIVPPASPLVLPQVQVTGSSKKSRLTAAWSQGLGGGRQKGRENEIWTRGHTERNRSKTDRVEKERQTDRKDKQGRGHRKRSRRHKVQPEGDRGRPEQTDPQRRQGQTERDMLVRSGLDEGKEGLNTTQIPSWGCRADMQG